MRVLAALALSALLPGPLAASVALPTGDDRLSVDPPGLDASYTGRSIDGRREVLLRFSGGRSITAGIGRTTILRTQPDAPPPQGRLAALDARLVRPLMPTAGLWLLESLDAGEDGLGLSRRLREAGLDAHPDWWLPRAKWDAPVPNDPKYPAQWFFADLNMPEAWALSRGTDTTTIVIVDDGCDLKHPDLAAKMDPGRDAVDGDTDPSYVPETPENSHGTACAGLAGAVTDNALGVAGACPECRLRCVRLLGAAASPVPESADVDAFQFALAADADVVSNSWGFTEAIPVPAPLADAINHVATKGRHGKGALVFFASGNDDRRVGDDELLAVDGVIGVGAVTHYGDRTSYSNFGASVDLVAPTGSVTTDISGPDGDNPGDYMTRFGGTSSACPIAAGIGGLLAAAAPELTAAELTALMLSTTRRAPYSEPDAQGHDDYYGRGIVDPVAALEQLVGAPAQETPPNPPGSAGDAPKGCGCGQAGVGVAAAAAMLVRRRRSGRAGRPWRRASDRADGRSIARRAAGRSATGRHPEPCGCPPRNQRRQESARGRRQSSARSREHRPRRGAPPPRASRACWCRLRRGVRRA